MKHNLRSESLEVENHEKVAEEGLNVKPLAIAATQSQRFPRCLKLLSVPFCTHTIKIHILSPFMSATLSSYRYISSSRKNPIYAQTHHPSMSMLLSFPLTKILLPFSPELMTFIVPNVAGGRIRLHSLDHHTHSL
jgi:hypothetical protein